MAAFVGPLNGRESDRKLLRRKNFRDWSAFQFLGPGVAEHPRESRIASTDRLAIRISNDDPVLVENEEIAIKLKFLFSLSLRLHCKRDAAAAVTRLSRTRSCACGHLASMLQR